MFAQITGTDKRVGSFAIGCHDPQQQLVMFMLNWCQFEVCGLFGGLAMLNVGVTYLQTIHKDLEKEEPVVKSTLAHAEELLGTSNQSKKVEKDQQYQKLRYNTSDLKVRFDAVSTLFCFITANVLLFVVMHFYVILITHTKSFIVLLFTVNNLQTLRKSTCVVY